MTTPPAPIRRMIADLIAKGCSVELRPDGTLLIHPSAPPPRDPFDLVEMKR